MKTVETLPDGSSKITLTGSDLEQFKRNVQTAAFGPAPVPEGCCVRCKEAFTDKNVFTPAGWRETKLSKMCEACWDAVFKAGD